MSERRTLFLLSVVCVALGAVFVDEALLAQENPSPSTNAPAKAAPAPLLLDDKPLLLLDDDPATNAASAGQIADNSRCFVCHMNYSMEQLAVQHARTNIGCVKCHGISDAHIADESWASGGNGTAPEIMIMKDKINLSCFECHAPKKLSLKDHIEFLWGTKPQQFCTDCHGKHRLPERKCKWK